jgi:mRNA interferase RelE/StbE
LKAKFKLEFTPRFERRFRSLDRQTQVRILRELQILTENPYAGKMLRGEWKSVYSLRIGEYRVLYLVQEERVILATVGHRRRVYRESV